jgi:hypothetical protein
MRVLYYIYDSEDPAPHVEAVLDELAARDEVVTHVDVAGAETREDGLREAMLSLRESIRIGSNPREIYDEDGTPDFSAGVLITEAETGRRSLHVGKEALEALRSER